MEETDQITAKEEENADDVDIANAAHTLAQDSVITAGKNEELLQEEMHNNKTVTSRQNSFSSHVICLDILCFAIAFQP
jgi:hypothetical protein